MGSKGLANSDFAGAADTFADDLAVVPDFAFGAVTFFFADEALLLSVTSGGVAVLPELPELAAGK
jgi:hypothetical protein